jgi:hypothetical protein
MRKLLSAVVMLVGVLAVSACGGGRHTVFTKFSRVGPLSIPTPSGFRSRTWADGVVISNGSSEPRIPCTTNDGCAGLAGHPSQDELVVYRTVYMEPPPALKLPLALQNLRQVNDGRTEWSGGGSIGTAGDYVVDIWLGPKAPAADRSAILSALEAIKSR